MTVDNGVLRICTPLVGRNNDLWAFTGPQRTVLFDTGVDGVARDHILPALDSAGIEPAAVSHVVVSHCDVDHCGGIRDVHTYLPDARVLAHPNDAGMMQDFSLFLQGRGRSFVDVYGLDERQADIDWMRAVTGEGRVDCFVGGFERIDLGDREIEILHVPGHSRGHLALHDRANATVAISDAILGSAIPGFGGVALIPPTYRHVEHYLHTIERIRQIAPRRLLTAHYGIYEDDAVAAFLDESEDFCRSLGRQVSSVVDELGNRSPQGFTLADCVDALVPHVGTWPREGSRNTLSFPVCGHLEKLLSDGRLVLDTSYKAARFFIS